MLSSTTSQEERPLFKIRNRKFSLIIRDAQNNTGNNPRLNAIGKPCDGITEILC